MDTQVRIILTAINDDVSPSQRVLTLNHENPDISVGRASKSVSKGLLGATNNAWFDSPVMSRDHAKISMNPMDRNITIQDIGSMHGTFLNDSELPRKSPMPINDGDIIVFGAEVRRGPETFPACTFRVNYRFGPYKPSNTFAFPDSSDIEDAEGDDFDFSDDDMDHHAQPSSEDGVSIESSSRKTADFDTIDLTRDESPGHSSPHPIDLTGYTPAENRILEMMSGRPVDIDQRADEVSIGIYAGNAPIVVETEDEEDAHFSSDSDDQSEGEIVFKDYGSTDDSIVEDESINGESESDDEEDFKQDSDQSDGESLHDYIVEEREPPIITNLTRFAIATHDNPPILISDMRTRVMLSESDSDDNEAKEDDESDLGLSDAGAEGMRALFGNDVIAPTPPAIIQEQRVAVDLASPNSMDANFAPEVNGISQQRSFTHVHDPDSEIADQAESSKPYDFSLPQPSTLGQVLDHGFSLFRQPSPSDAAMVKISATPVRSSVATSTRDLGVFGQPTAQSLGDKSGKGAFFEAREFNKAKFNSNGVGTTITSSREENSVNPESKKSSSYLGIASDKQGKSQVPHLATIFGKPHFAMHRGSALSAESLADANLAIRDTCPFLDKPDDKIFVDREISPLPDMTSAFSYNNSKDSSFAKTQSAQHQRSGIKINDIIDNSSTIQSTNLKRKAEDISDVTENELRVWGNNSTTSGISLESPNLAANETALAGLPAVDPTIPEIHGVVPRPTKRLKKLLENVGYAALGGVAVGAGLFSVLVATAPEFL